MSGPDRWTVSAPSRLHVARAAGGALMLLGTVVIGIGWVMGVDVVTRVIPGLESMKVNTALGIVGLGLAPLLRAGGSRRGWVPGLAVAILGVLTWAQYLGAGDLGIDQLLIADGGGGDLPGRMGLNTAVCLSFLGVAWVTADDSTPTPIFAVGQLLALASTLLALFALIGYVFGVASSRGIGSATEMALHTSLALVVAGIAFAVATSSRGWLKVLWSEQVGGQLGRALLLPGVVAVLISGLIAEALATVGLLNTVGLQLVFQTTLVTLVLGVQVTIAANRLERVGQAEAEARREAAIANARLAAINAELEQRVGERTKELAVVVDDLKRTNDDLESFTFAASHDLKEPLRMVTMYTGLLADRYRDQLDDRGRTYADFAVEGAERMRQLIAGVLQFTAAGRDPLRTVPVDMTSLARDVAVELAAETGHVQVQSPLPRVVGDPSVLHNVLRAVVDNGLKFISPGATPRVVISGRLQADGMAVIEVADNGIGMSDPDRAGEMFLRLNHRADYEGSGVSLAVARRQLRRHHGDLVASPGRDGGTVVEIRIGTEVPPSSG